MRALNAGETLVVASHNPGKVWEIKQLIAPYGLKAVSAGDLDLPEPEETETTFAGNARLKAVAAATASGHAALADDSGLEVAALDGAPGIYSARWAGADKDFQLAMRRVAEGIETAHGKDGFDWERERPRANFICALCLAWPDGTTEIFEGRVDGHLVWPTRGGQGFGYDPMFVADGMTETFGEIEPAAKHAMSHRRRAFDLFEQQCLSQLQKTSPGHNTDDVVAGLQAAAANLSSRDEFVQFLKNLQTHLDETTVDVQQPDAGSVVQSLLSWARDNQSSENEPKWRTLANAVLAASQKG